MTVNLSPSQAKVYKRAINQHRKMEDILKEMRELSFRILEKTTTGVAKRKPRK